jgi:hypothetical protein
MNKKKEKEDKKGNELSRILNLEGMQYNIKLKLIKAKINIMCTSTIDYLSLYDYSLDISFQEFLNLGKCFKSCSNLEEIFNLLKNILKGIRLSIIKNESISNKGANTNTGFFSDDYENNSSSVNLECQEGKTFKIILKIPLLSGSTELITLELNKKEKNNIIESYNKLRQKYLNVKRYTEDKFSVDSETIKKIKSEVI